MTVYLIDHEQQFLHALPIDGTATPDPIEVQTTAAGEAFMTVQTVSDPDSRRFWIPMIDGSERLGVVIVHCAPDVLPDKEFVGECETFVGLLGHLVATKLPYGDLLHRVRRTRAMSPAGELLLSMLPPLTFSCADLVISAILEPAYDVGGDAFDYAVDGAMARLFILDAMGRGLSAAMTSATTLAAIRASRREGDDIHQMAQAGHTAIRSQFSDLRFVTGILSELDLATGILRYVNAGHPPAVLIRRGKAVKELTDGGRVPMGLFDTIGPAIGTEMMQPGDRLLFYTDGMVEARDAEGQIFGLDRLIDLVERHADDTLPAPETLRRLSHSVIAHQSGPPLDDATMLLVEWSAAAAQRMTP